MENQHELQPSKPRWVGIDGCRAGWFYVGISDDSDFSFGVLPEFSRVKLLLKSAERVLVDMPIGLPSAKTPTRTCETLARQRLRHRRSSVFSVPARSVLSAPTYQAANEENRRVLGVGLSRQSWAIVPKIAEVDAFLSQTRDERIHEMHPELAFWALNNKAPMEFNKRKEPGLTERLEVLDKHYPASLACFEKSREAFRKYEVANDDIVDAMVGAVTALNGRRLKSLPIEPVADENGLMMKMVYADV